MPDNLKGDGPYTHGGSTGTNGPAWARNWELQTALATSTTHWPFME